MLVGTCLINHFDLFGLRQVYLYQRGEEYTHLTFRTPFLYKIVRHPIMLVFIIAFWSTPHMTIGYLVFDIVTTAYIVIAIQFEERDILSMHGTAYEEYRKQVSMLLPIPKEDKTLHYIRHTRGSRPSSVWEGKILASFMTEKLARKSVGGIDRRLKKPGLILLLWGSTKSWFRINKEIMNA